jgi:hypothetical protein
MAIRLLLNGSEFQVNVDNGGGNGISGSQLFPDATVLSDGRFVIGYQSAYFGSASEVDPIIRIFGGTNYLDVSPALGKETDLALAPRNDGGVGIVFADTAHGDGSADANGPNIIYMRASAAGVTPPAQLAIADFNGGSGHDELSNPAIATLADGRQVVVFERAYDPNVDDDIYLNVINAAGTATQFGPAGPAIVSDTTNNETSPSVAASGNQALVVYSDRPVGGTTDVSARLFDGGSNTLGPRFTIADHTDGLELPAVAALPDNRYVIVYKSNRDVFGRIFDPLTPGGAFLSDEFQISVTPATASFTGGGLDIAPTVDGGFIVTWWGWRDQINDVEILAHRFDAHGVSYGDIFTVNTLTNDFQSRPTIATSGADVLIAWRDLGFRATDSSPSGVRAQFLTTTAFDYDSAGIGDLNGDGRVDVLFQNDTGDVAVWQTNGNGAVSAITDLGQRPAGYLIDGTGNFNSTPGDDILLRSSGGTLAIWPTAGIATGAPIVIGNAPNTYHNAGVGDFTGDGQEDLLFRHDTGQIVSWAVANNGLAAAPKVLGATSLTYHIVGIDDFTGDHQADILFRNDDGTIAVWQVANNQLLSAQAVGSTSTAFHIVSTGDFDGNGAKDILFRGDDGELVEWLLDSTGGLLMAPQSIGTVPLNYHVDGTGDLNGDGRDDIIFRDAGGTVVEWLMNGLTLAGPPAVMGTIAVDYAIAAHHFDVV